MASMVDLTIAGRVYQVACRDGEEENLRTAARLVDAKCREALAGLGTLSEARQFLFAALLLADRMIEEDPQAAAPAAPDPVLAGRAETLAARLESIADALEQTGP
jgi:cell division protein ZapA